MGEPGAKQKHAAAAPHNLNFLELIHYVYWEGDIKRIKYSQKKKRRIMGINLRIASS